MEKMHKLNIRTFAWATLVPIGIMLIAMWVKPLWRDEYFSLYYADPSKSLTYLLEHRWGPDSHPPIHNVFLYYWTHIFSHPFLQKGLSLVFLVLGGFALNYLTPSERKREFYTFSLVCLGSYWIIYFATEIRPYVMNFMLCAVTVFLLPHLIKDRPAKGYWIIWMLTGSVLSLTHFFGGLWFASLSFVLGLSFLQQKQNVKFAVTGCLAIVGLTPLMGWLYFSLPQIDVASVASDMTGLEKFTGAGHQFLRGLIVKTFGSNPVITVLGFGGLVAGFRLKDQFSAILIWACILTVSLAFILHLGFVDMIKERAFIVIMPALLFLMAAQLATSTSKWTKYVPWAAAIMPFFFLGEYTKNKEDVPGLQQAVASFGQICSQAEIGAFYRPSKFTELYPYATHKILNFDLKDFSARPVIYNLSELTTPMTSDCPVIAIAVLLPKQDMNLIEQAEQELTRLGYNLDTIERRLFGKGRNILWIRKDS